MPNTDVTDFTPAAHIVKCVNAHDALVNALKRVATDDKLNIVSCQDVARNTLQSIGETV